MEITLWQPPARTCLLLELDEIEDLDAANSAIVREIADEAAQGLVEMGALVEGEGYYNTTDLTLTLTYLTPDEYEQAVIDACDAARDQRFEGHPSHFV